MKKNRLLQIATLLFIPLAIGVALHAQNQPRDNAGALMAEIAQLSAPCHSIPLEVTRPLTHRPPSGDVNVKRELTWRALYATEPNERRAASRVVSPGVSPDRLGSLIAAIDAVDDTDQTRLPNVEQLQNPIAIPALRRALSRLNTPMKQIFVLQALYACGDWNHRDKLLALMQAKTQTAAAFDLLATYHPKEATQASLELLDMSDAVCYGFNKDRSDAMAQKAVNALERLNYPQIDELYMAYFKKWPAPLIAVKFGDRGTQQAKPLVQKALADAATSPFFNNFLSIISYRYALARMGDSESLNWMLAKANLLKDAPDITAPTRDAWEEANGITSGDVGPFCDLLVKTGNVSTTMAYVELLTKEAGNRVQSSISPKSLYLIRDDSIVDALEVYFARHGGLESKLGLTDPKKILALYPNSPKAMKLMEMFIPDKAARADLLSLAKEFGPAGLNPNAGTPVRTAPHP